MLATLVGLPVLLRCLGLPEADTSTASSGSACLAFLMLRAMPLVIAPARCPPPPPPNLVWAPCSGAVPFGEFYNGAVNSEEFNLKVGSLGR